MITLRVNNQTRSVDIRPTSRALRLTPTIASSMRLFRMRPTRPFSRAGVTCCIGASPILCATAFLTLRRQSRKCGRITSCKRSDRRRDRMVG